MSVTPPNPNPSPIGSFFTKAKEAVQNGAKFVGRKIKENESLVKKVAFVALGVLLFATSPVNFLIGGAAGLAVGLIFPKQVEWVVNKVKDAWHNSGLAGKIALGAAGAASCFLLPTAIPSFLYGSYAGSLLQRKTGHAPAGPAAAVSA